MSPLSRCLAAAVLIAATACTPDYSPDIYASNVVQLANKVESGLVIGFREVEIRANGTVGAVTGGAVGGILGAQAGEFGLNPALGGVGGSAVGGLLGTAIAHATADTTGWEYIVRKDNGELLSVTQREPVPIPLGQKVLVITGPQARIIRDYSAPPPPPPAAPVKDRLAEPAAPPPVPVPVADAEPPAAAPSPAVAELPPEPSAAGSSP
ncbi:MAG: hypothetical protein HY985_04945 [Magnetospirillum sp.]|nr:hypothetical protein [Magnetospirillum sp.]